MCALVCPEGCIHEDEEGMFVPDLDYCKGCGICEEICPKKSIRMEKEEK
jgi:pyruvate ferredoxin oxidoreductase delta subunit